MREIELGGVKQQPLGTHQHGRAGIKRIAEDRVAARAQVNAKLMRAAPVVAVVAVAEVAAPARIWQQKPLKIRSRPISRQTS